MGREELGYLPRRWYLVRMGSSEPTQLRRSQEQEVPLRPGRLQQVGTMGEQESETLSPARAARAGVRAKHLGCSLGQSVTVPVGQRPLIWHSRLLLNSSLLKQDRWCF